MTERGAPLKNTERDKAIVQRVTVGNERLSAVALAYGITPTRVHQIVKRASAERARAAADARTAGAHPEAV